MFQPILFRIENVKVWGCSSTQYGIRFFNNGGGPANVWSTAGSIVRASSVYGTTNADAEVAAEPLNRTSIGIDNQVSDVTFIGCEAAYHLECFRHRRGGIIMSACHIWNGYPPDHSKAFTNPTGIYVEEDVSLTVDSCYIDNCVIKAESGLKLQVTNNQWFTAAAVACGYCVRLRPQTSNDLLENFVMTGNQVHGTFSKLVEIDTTDGSFLKTNKAVVADNVILDYDTGNKGLANQSKGRVVASVVPGDFIGTDVSIDISSYMLLPSNADTPLITVSYNQGTLGNVVFNGYKWTAGGVVTLRFDQTFTGNVVIDYDQTFVTNFL